MGRSLRDDQGEVRRDQGRVGRQGGRVPPGHRTRHGALHDAPAVRVRIRAVRLHAVRQQLLRAARGCFQRAHGHLHRAGLFPEPLRPLRTRRMGAAEEHLRVGQQPHQVERRRQPGPLGGRLHEARKQAGGRGPEAHLAGRPCRSVAAGTLRHRRRAGAGHGQVHRGERPVRPRVRGELVLRLRAVLRGHARMDARACRRGHLGACGEDRAGCQDDGREANLGAVGPGARHDHGVPCGLGRGHRPVVHHGADRHPWRHGDGAPAVQHPDVEPARPRRVPDARRTEAAHRRRGLPGAQVFRRGAHAGRHDGRPDAHEPSVQDPRELDPAPPTRCRARRRNPTRAWSRPTRTPSSTSWSTRS